VIEVRFAPDELVLEPPPQPTRVDTNRITTDDHANLTFIFEISRDFMGGLSVATPCRGGGTRGEMHLFCQSP
jgi:hypothetical protein